MTQPSLLEAAEAPVPDGHDFTAAVAAFMLRSHGRWVNALELERVGGRHAWRTRLSEARRRYHFTTENRVRTVRADADGRHYRVSEYRVVEG